MKHDIHDLIGDWHDGWGSAQPLHEYLHLTWEQYKTWAEGGQLPPDCDLYDPDRGAP
jgi:hypothetical protein